MPATQSPTTPNTAAPRLGDPVFLSGHARSGTTLLAALLDNHPDLTVFPEETFFLRKYANAPELTVDQLADLLITSVRRKAAPVDSAAAGSPPPIPDGWSAAVFAWDVNDVEAHFRRIVAAGATEPRHVLEALVSVYALQANQQNRRYWVEKTHGNEDFLPLLTRWYPALRALYIVRDPRDVYVSWRDRMRASHKPYALMRFIGRWARSLARWRAWQKAHPQRAFALRYESLLHAPEQTMREVARFLQIPFHQTLLQPTKHGRPWSGNSLHDTGYAAISTAPVGRYRVQLTPADRDLISLYLGRAMHELGYPVRDRLSPLNKATRYAVELARADANRLSLLKSLVRLRLS